MQKIFQVEDSKVSNGNFRFCGREISQEGDFSIKATCKDTTEKLEKVQYRTQVKKESPADEGEKAQLRSVVGSLAWIARQASPDHSYRVSGLQSKCNHVTIKDLVYANQSVNEAKEHSNHGINFKSGERLTGRHASLSQYQMHHGATRKQCQRKRSRSTRARELG